MKEKQKQTRKENKMNLRDRAKNEVAKKEDFRDGENEEFFPLVVDEVVADLGNDNDATDQELVEVVEEVVSNLKSATKGWNVVLVNLK